MRRSVVCIFLLNVFVLLPAVARPPQEGGATIASAQPSILAPGTEITVSGSGFGVSADNHSVWLGGREASIKSWSDTRIVAIVPIGAFTNEVVVRKGKKTVGTATLPVLPALATSAVAINAGKTNGILVNDIKIYDDQALQQALNAARAQLAAIQVINQSGITSQVGSLQGATLSQSAFAVNLGTAPTPGVQATANTGNTLTTAAQGANNQQNSGSSLNTTTSGTNNQVTNGGSGNTGAVTTIGGATPGTQTTLGGSSSTQNQSTTSSGDTLAVTGPSTQTTNTTNNQTQVTGPSTQTVTTQASVNPIVPTLTPSSLSLPSAYSPGASNILNEQLELTYEITGYQLLLEGALSDHYLRYLQGGEPVQMVRPRATIGVPITIDPSKHYKNAVAEITLAVEVRTADAVVPEPPIVTAILPRDKTYNVAAITDKSVSIGGAVATQVISLGVSALWGHKAYFVVQDQDTVALQLPPDPGDGPATTRFGWQIRPVLGQKVVSTGMRNCFVQLAFPELPIVPSYGWIRVTTRWRKYDQENGIVLDEIPGSKADSTQPFDIPRFKLNPVVGPATYEDNADGSVTVFAKGDYLDGTFAKVGPLAFIPGVNGTVQDPSGIRFTLPANQLATHNAYLVDRGGDATEIVDALVQHSNARCIAITAIEAGPAGAGMTKVTVTVTLTNSAECVQRNSKPFTTTKDLVAVVGNQVFGLRNAPFLSAAVDNVSFLVPTGLLQSSRHVTVKRLLWGEAFESGKDLDENTFRTTPIVGQATVVSQTTDQLKIVLIGTGLKGLKPLLPRSAVLDPQEDSGAILTVPMADLKDLKQMVLQDQVGEIFLVSLPAASAAQTPKIATVTKGQTKVSIPAGGQDLESLVQVQYEGKNLAFVVAADRKSVSISASSMTAISGTKELVFVFKGNKKVTYTITVVDLKVDVPAPQPSN
jgi:hypothetical protein